MISASLSTRSAGDSRPAHAVDSQSGPCCPFSLSSELGRGQCVSTQLGLECSGEQDQGAPLVNPQDTGDLIDPGAVFPAAAWAKALQDMIGEARERGLTAEEQVSLAELTQTLRRLLS